MCNSSTEIGKTPLCLLHLCYEFFKFSVAPCSPKMVNPHLELISSSKPSLFASSWLEIYVYGGPKSGFLPSSSISSLPNSFPRCSCDDLCWIWFSDDIPSSLWLWKYCIQHALGLLCDPVVHDHLRSVPVHRPGAGGGCSEGSWHDSTGSVLHHQSGT